ncbi:hypothetical protein K501DRAFT_266785 [Backusella circina FSU 941]|nr:hypothetical protein K501DRAFT_266785 [Backusella circina FSU 941]
MERVVVNIVTISQRGDLLQEGLEEGEASIGVRMRYERKEMPIKQGKRNIDDEDNDDDVLRWSSHNKIYLLSFTDVLRWSSHNKIYLPVVVTKICQFGTSSLVDGTYHTVVVETTFGKNFFFVGNTVGQMFCYMETEDPLHIFARSEENSCSVLDTAEKESTFAIRVLYKMVDETVDNSTATISSHNPIVVTFLNTLAKDTQHDKNKVNN